MIVVIVFIVVFSLIDVVVDYFENKRLLEIQKMNAYYQKNNIPIQIDPYD